MEKGFTLLELMITLVIGGLMLSIGVPNFIESVRNSNMTATTNTLVAALNLARSEAIKRRVRVTLCRANLGVAPQCDANGDGVVVFANTADDQNVDASDTVLRAVRWLREEVDLVYDGLPIYVSLAPSGFTQAIGGGPLTGNVVFCDARGTTAARVLTVMSTGRPLVRAHGDVPAIPVCP